MRDLAELNINEGGKPVSRMPPSVEMIDSLQHRLGLALPPEYLLLLRHANGGHPQLDIFQPEGADSNNVYAVNHFLHLDEDRTNPRSLWFVMEHWQGILGDRLFPFAEDGLGNPFLLDLRTTPASVKMCLHDEQFRVVNLATSFEAFIDGLVLDHDAI